MNKILMVLNSLVDIRKICSKCRKRKSLSEFNRSRNGKYGRHHYCKECHRASFKYVNKYSKTKWQLIKLKYNLTKEDYDNIIRAQDYKCGICENSIVDGRETGGVHIDHCHKNGNVRGILCRKCNHLIGNANDDVNILSSAIRYLKNSVAYTQ